MKERNTMGKVLHGLAEKKPLDIVDVTYEDRENCKPYGLQCGNLIINKAYKCKPKVNFHDHCRIFDQKFPSKQSTPLAK